MPITQRLLGIAGSLRSAAYSRAELAAVAEAAASRVQFDFADIGALPHFNQDLYVEPLPAAVQHFRDQIAAADGLVISSSRLLRLSPAVFVPSTSFGKR